jgi:hypothetical protein
MNRHPLFPIQEPVDTQSLTAGSFGVFYESLKLASVVAIKLLALVEQESSKGTPHRFELVGIGHETVTIWPNPAVSNQGTSHFLNVELTFLVLQVEFVCDALFSIPKTESSVLASTIAIYFVLVWFVVVSFVVNFGRFVWWNVKVDRW